MIFPFLNDATGGLIGHTFSVYLNGFRKNLYEPVSELTFMPEGKTAEGWSWAVTDGILEVLNDAGEVVQRYNGVELVNGAVSATGFVIEDGGYRRAVLCPKKGLGETDWKVFVSASPTHGEEVTKKLVKSFKRAKVDIDKVMMVSGGIPGAESFSKRLSSARHISSVSDMSGYTALGASSTGDYRVLLHGTCEVSEDFLARMEGLNVSLNPDIILFTQEWEMGVYSERFLSQQGDLNALDPQSRLEILRSRAKVVVIMKGRPVLGITNDVYGEKSSRTAFVLPKVGVTKFKSASKR